MKVAIPLFGKRISPRLDCAQKVLLADISEKERRIISSGETVFDAENKTAFFLTNHIDVVICGGISIEMQDLFLKQKMEIISWVTGEAEKALELFIQGKLFTGAMLYPGMRMRRWRFCCQRKNNT